MLRPGQSIGQESFRLSTSTRIPTCVIFRYEIFVTFSLVTAL